MIFNITFNSQLVFVKIQSLHFKCARWFKIMQEQAVISLNKDSGKNNKKCVIYKSNIQMSVSSIWSTLISKWHHICFWNRQKTINSINVSNEGSSLSCLFPTFSRLRCISELETFADVLLHKWDISFLISIRQFSWIRSGQRLNGFKLLLLVLPSRSRFLDC